MADIVTSIVGAIALYFIGQIVRRVAPYLVGLFDKVAPLLVDPVHCELGYLFYYHSNIKDLKDQLGKLRDVRDRVERSIEVAKRNADEILPHVEKWQKRVDEIIKEAEEKFPNDEERANGLCPNWKSRYHLSKKAKETTAEIVLEIQAGEKFYKSEGVSYPAPPQGIGCTPTKGYEDFVSRMSTLNDVMETLKDPSISMVGVSGMGGVGKTMLVTELARKVREDKLFEEVVMAIVSQTPNIRKIQEEIAYQLSLRFEDNETDPQRKDRLCKRLKNEKSILVILDDIWDKLDLEAVGIPSGENHKGCKIVMTSRNQDTVCNDMGAKRNFLVKVLPDEEAWNLFKKIAGDFVEAPELKLTATEVAKECAGLPLAMVAVANALKNKDLPLWEDALQQLRFSTPTDIPGMDTKVYSSLKLSYDYLGSEQAKSLFLLCSLLPEDYNISIQDFLKYGKGLDLFKGGTNTLEKRRKRALTLVDHLKASSLLLESNTSGFVRMHDVVRDVGISLASEDKHMLILRNGIEPEEWTTEEKLGNCPAISLPYSNIYELPTGLNCPKLKLLLLFSNDRSLEIPNTFFEGMKQLKVLDLKNISFSTLPSSLHFLSNLQTLCLDQCMFQDTAIIGELKKLEVLSFKGSDIKELPRETGLLTCLRLLDLSDCSNLRVIPSNVIAKLSQLEYLYMGNSFAKWEVDGNASLAELKQLSHLVTLDIGITDDKIMPKDLRFETLEKYRIFIGDVWDWYGVYESSKILKLKLNTGIQQEGIKLLLKRTEVLYLDELSGIGSDLYSLNREGFPHLKHLDVQKGCEIEYLINTMEGISSRAFPKLESLFLHNLNNLKEICYGQPPGESFCNLRKLNVHCCGRLKNLLSVSMVRSLSRLQEVGIESCYIMDGIVAEGRERPEGNQEADTITFPQLWRLNLRDLPMLMSVCSERKTKHSLNQAPAAEAGSKEIILEGERYIPMPFYTEKVAFPNLVELDVKNIPLIWHCRLSVDSFRKLRHLRFQNCRHLLNMSFKNILTTSMVNALVQLLELKILDCDMVEEIVEKVGVQEAAPDKTVFPQLTALGIGNLRNLKSFCQGIHISEWPSLKNLQVFGCPSVEIFFTELSSFKETCWKDHLGTQMKRPLFLVNKVAFPNLEELEFNKLSTMKETWQGQFHAQSFHKLRHLKVTGCEKILKIFPISFIQNLQNLEILFIDFCNSLEEIFELGGVSGEARHATALPQLRELWLFTLPKLMHLWKKDSPPTPVFQNLTTLTVHSCGRLTHLLPFSIAKSLVQIKSILVEYCDIMKEIFASEEGEATNETTFNQLYSLRLSNLPNLTSFCRGCHTFSFPSLEEVLVEECLKLETFSNGILNTPKLEKVQVQGDECVWKGDFNSTIQHLFVQKEPQGEVVDLLTASSSSTQTSYPLQKKWVDNNSGHISFMLYARSFYICWGTAPEYWTWNCLKETRDETIEVAKLIKVCWLDVGGNFEISDLSPGIVYEVVYVVKLTDESSGWEFPITLRLSLPDGKAQERQVSLLEKPKEEWIELNVGNFNVENGETGEVYFNLAERGGHWKGGLILKGAIIRPKILLFQD